METVGPSVSASVRQRGRSYFKGGLVEILRADEAEVDARVRGSRLYDVRVAIEPDGMAFECDCPYFESNPGVCKHIWATILAAEADGHLSDGRFLEEPAQRRVPRLSVVRSPDTEDLEAWQDDEADGSVPYEDQDRPASAAGRMLARQEAFLSGRLPATAHPRSRWELQVSAIAERYPQRSGGNPLGAQSAELLWEVDAAATRSNGKLTINVLQRHRKQDGSWAKPKSLRLTRELVEKLSDPFDRQALSMIMGTGDTGAYAYYAGYGYGRGVPGAGIEVPDSLADALVPLICGSGRGRLSSGLAAAKSETASVPLTLDEGDPWELFLEASADASGGFTVGARIQRGRERVPIDEPAIVTRSFVFHDDGVVSRFEDFGCFSWVSSFRGLGQMSVPAEDSAAFLEHLVALPALPRLDFPQALSWTEITVEPRPALQLRPSPYEWGLRSELLADLSFDYGGVVVAQKDPRRGAYEPESRRMFVRDRDAEDHARKTLDEVGFRVNRVGDLVLRASRLPAVVRALSRAGWRVEAEGRLYRTPGVWTMQVSSGIDWFDLTASVNFGEAEATLPEVLAAARRGDGFIRLGDGSLGILPEDWLARYGPLAGLGAVNEDSIRFGRTQSGLLDALLAAQPEVNVDEVFARARRELLEFEGIKPASAPAGFHGKLRPYQREGLGWLYFLQRFGFGGCLADDMGLGKTVQVLALLESRRALRETAAGRSIPSSLVVVPRSLVFNWLEEAARFSPRLRILDHTGDRTAPGPHFEDYDVVLTTYGTLRRDAADITGVKFDYCILDEAQAIKNPQTASAKAARLVKADHRLALSGTPIENHLGELWSLFEFLNPGMLGGSTGLFVAPGTARIPSPETLQMLVRALRPFILRRTKDQVATELPKKTEQTLLCELKGPQRREYERLRDHYRSSLIRKVERDGLGKSKMQVLEALLRLRQAACHPGLIDPKRTGESSAKLDSLIPQVVEVAEEGHKSLVFSQFTRFLAIVRDRLDREGVVYEYLDGRTRDRRARVDRFQNDPACSTFLISLKAGGLGLNLTAAEYVFLLDPWWNPAVEAQAIDRTHRIGQSKPVFAYRIIAAGTVEEKVVELQESKRALADSIISADNTLIRNLKPEDLDLLLS